MLLFRANIPVAADFILALVVALPDGESAACAARVSDYGEVRSKFLLNLRCF
jgi:hypothetical protein